jgi:hypothetical protein
MGNCSYNKELKYKCKILIFKKEMKDFLKSIENSKYKIIKIIKIEDVKIITLGD